MSSTVIKPLYITLFCDCLVNEVEFVGEVKYAESVWMKVRGERGRSALYKVVYTCLLMIEI